MNIEAKWDKSPALHALATSYYHHNFNNPSLTEKSKQIHGKAKVACVRCNGEDVETDKRLV
jgi:hypothetical protein